MDIQTFIRDRIGEEAPNIPPWKTTLDLRILTGHTDDGPPCQTLQEMAARWATHPEYEEIEPWQKT